eukprot:Em0014g510a
MAENEVKLAYFQDISRSKSRQLDMVKEDESYIGGVQPLENSSRSRQREASCDQTPAQTLHELAPMDGGTVDHLESCDGMTDDCSTEKSKKTHCCHRVAWKEQPTDLNSVEKMLKMKEKNCAGTCLYELSRELAGSKGVVQGSHKEIQELSCRLNVAESHLEKSIEDRKMVLAQLQLSTKSLSEAETKNRELLKQYEDLRAQFLRSEEARKLAEGSCTELLKQSRQQIGVCEELSAKVKSMEATADECNQQRAALKESHDILQKKFIEKVQSEAVLSEKCSGLERKLEKKDLIAEEFFQKPGEGSKWRSDSVQFDLTTTYQERKRLKEDILHYENELQRHKEIQNRLNKEVMDLTAKLMSVNSDKKDLLGKLEAAYNRLQYSEEQRSALQFYWEFSQKNKSQKQKLPKPGIEPGTFRSSV